VVVVVVANYSGNNGILEQKYPHRLQMWPTECDTTRHVMQSGAEGERKLEQSTKKWYHVTMWSIKVEVKIIKKKSTGISDVEW